MPSPYSFKQRMILTLGASLGPWLIRLFGKLCRFRVEGMEHYLHAAEQGGVILALWHGRMLLPIYFLRNRGISALVSRSWDGELIARIVNRLGYITRRGSPKEGGWEGFVSMLKDLREGLTVAILPDGPTGPRYSLHDGVLHLARLSGVPIVPFTFSARPVWRANSWDRFMIQKPFSRALILFTEPLTVPRQLDEQELAHHRRLIRQRLIDAEREADRRLRLLYA